jgi:general secretion pathway protein K
MNRRGSILVAVLLLASLLTIFIGVAADRLAVADGATRNAAENIAADVAVRGAVEYLYARTGGHFADADGVVRVDYPGLVVEATAEDEADRIDLNHAAPDLIAGIFRTVGIDSERAALYARIIADWRRDPTTRPVRGRTPMVPPHGAIEHMREFDRLREIPPEAMRLVAPYVTVTGLTGRVAALTAPRQVVAALPGMDPGRVEAFLRDRVAEGGKFDALIRRYGIVADHVSKVGSIATRLRVTVRIGSHRSRGYEVVVAVLPGDGEPYRFLAWTGDVPPPAGARW